MARSLTEIPSSIETLQQTRVVDADVHLTYNATLREAIASYMDKPFNKYVHPESGGGYSASGWNKSLGGKRRFHIIDVNEPDDIVRPLCDGFDVDNPIINTSAPLDDLINTDRAIAEMKGVNDMLLDRFLDENNAFYGLASITTKDPEAAVEEIERIGDERQIVGVYFYQGEFQKPLGDSSHDIIFDALAAKDLVPVFHISGMHRKAPGIREMEKSCAWHATGPVWAGMYAAVSLITQGTPAKFPELDFVILESDISAIPLLMYRLNREWGQWRSELPLLEQSPERYIRESFYFGTQPLPEFENYDHMHMLLDMIGPDVLMYASDHPHYDFDDPSALNRFLDHFTAADRNKILHGNAEQVFGI